MPTPAPADLKLGAIKPQDAVDAFTKRGLLQPTFAWQDVFQEEHGRAFAVAGVMRMDVLAAFRAAVDDAVTHGMHLQDFKDSLLPTLVQAGFWGDVEVTDPATGEVRTTRFNDARLRLIYDVNTRQSHAAGRWARIERNTARQPLVMYTTMRDERVRASHAPWDGLVLPVDHPFWNTHYPPNGWRCRCTAFALSERDVQRLRDAGQPVKTEPPPEQWTPFVNPRTGVTTAVPNGVDPGFAYNPGKARDAAFFDAALQKALVNYPDAAAQVVAQATADNARMVSNKTAEFARWVDEVAARPKPLNELQLVGVVKPQVQRTLQATGDGLLSAVLGTRDTDVLHALAVGVPTLHTLPKLLDEVQAVYRAIDSDPTLLLYLVNTVDKSGQPAQLVLAVESVAALPVQGGRLKVPINLVRLALDQNPAHLKNAQVYTLVWGTP